MFLFLWCCSHWWPGSSTEFYFGWKNLLANTLLVLFGAPQSAKTTALKATLSVVGKTDIVQGMWCPIFSLILHRSPWESFINEQAKEKSQIAVFIVSMDELLSANRVQRNSVLQLALWESWKSFLLACKNFFASRKKRAALVLVLPHSRIFARSAATHKWLTCILDILEFRNTFFKKKKWHWNGETRVLDGHTYKTTSTTWFILLQVTKGFRFQKNKNVRFISGNFSSERFLWKVKTVQCGLYSLTEKHLRYWCLEVFGTHVTNIR